jgi:ATP-dependent DNA helicase RecQ
MGRLTDQQRIRLHELGIPPLKWVQEEVISALLSARDTLALLPTGTGKSLCFQVPALLTGRPTLVISPLLALMQDQVAQLSARGIRSAHWSSLTTPAHERAIIHSLQSGNLQLLYLSPEKLALPRVREVVADINWAVLAIDEAHCVVTWGESFRPHYLTVGKFLYQLAQVRGTVRFSCTATATPETVRRLQRSLRLKRPRVITVPNLRPNLQLGIVRPPSPAATEATLFRMLQQWWEHGTGSALVYVSTRLETERLADWLQATGLPAQAFHAGLPRRLKLQRLEDFCSPRRALFVATCALGMGVDQPEVRLVIHAQSPTDLESYVQEVGRAGRDGAPAQALWLYQQAQFLETVEERKQKEPERWSDLRQAARQVMKLAESNRCINQTLQEIFSGKSIPPSCLLHCTCNRCDLRPWLIGPQRQHFRFP